MAIDPARLESHARMLSETFRPRNWKHPENLDRAAVYIHKEFGQAKGAVSEQPYEMEGREYRNVIAAFGPDTAEKIVVGAHYDALGEFPGADDKYEGALSHRRFHERREIIAGVQVPLIKDHVDAVLAEPVCDAPHP